MIMSIRSRRVRLLPIGLALAAALADPPTAARAQEVAVEDLEDGAPAAVEKKTRKQDRAERLKYHVEPRTAKRFREVRELLDAQRYADAEARLGRLRLDKLSPHELAQAQRLYGYVLYGQERNDGAIERLRQALADPEALQARDRADVLFQIAQIQGVERRWQDVIATLETWFATVERPNSVGYFLMALSNYQLQNLDAALLPAKKAVQIADVPQQGWLQLLLAIHLTQQDYAAAKPVLERMIALYPNSGKDYWLQLSALHGVTGDEAAALGVLEVAHRKGLLTDDRDLRRLLQMMLARGIPHRAARLFDDGMEDGRFEGDAEALELQSIGWILAREPEKALAPLARAAELAPKGDLYVRLAQLHLLQEEWDKAADVLHKALDKGGLADPGTAQLMLGIACYNEHQLHEARSWFAQAQRSGATRQQAATWLEHVDREIDAQRTTPNTAG
jgi:tetratricopeptide (TPR) repeat protein